MKTTIIEDNKPYPKYTYPCLLLEKATGTICLATGPCTGVCLHSGADYWSVGYSWPEGNGSAAWERFRDWVLIDQPATITIRFEP